MRSGDGSSICRPDGTRVAFDVRGSGPPVVLLHGLLGERRRWDPVSELLAASFTCVRIDLRGHGASDRAEDGSLLAMVGDVAAVADELGLVSPAVVGNSLGGSAAVLFAALHGAGAVVVVDASLRPSDLARRVRPLAARLRGAGFVEAMVEFEESLVLGPIADDVRQELLAALRAADPRVVLALWEPLLATSDDDLNARMASALSQLRSPCLCLHGSPPASDYRPWLERHAPTARLEVWLGMGHLLHLVDPVRFADRVRAFLGG